MARVSAAGCPRESRWLLGACRECVVTNWPRNALTIDWSIEEGRERQVGRERVVVTENECICSEALVPFD